MKVNDQDYAINTRGHNFVVINIVTKEIETVVFDTWGDPDSVSNVAIVYCTVVASGQFILARKIR